MPIRQSSLKAIVLLGAVLPLLAIAPANWLASRQLRPTLLETDLPRIEAYLVLDDAQKAAVHALLDDQLALDQVAIDAVTAALADAHADERDELDMLRSRWVNAWEPASAPATSQEGRAFIRSIVSDYLERLDRVEMTPSDAAEVLDEWRVRRGRARLTLLQDIELLLDAPQRDRWSTAMAAAALARSPWRAVLPQERLDLDALLVHTLPDAAQSPRWLDLRADWLSRIGEAIRQRDAVLSRNEARLLDARHRRQPGLVLHLERSNLAAREALVQVLEDVRKSMVDAMGSMDTINAFQREAQVRMAPDIWRTDDIDRLARAALAIDAIDIDTRAAIEAVWARHRSRRAAVQAHLMQQAPGAELRRRLRPLEHRLLARLFGHGAALIGLHPEADRPLSETQRLNGRLREARRLALDELELAIPAEHHAVAQSQARRRVADRQARLAANPPGSGKLALPINASSAPSVDAATP